MGQLCLWDQGAVCVTGISVPEWPRQQMSSAQGEENTSF